MKTYPSFKACAAHVAPVYLNAEKTVDKACTLVAEAARADDLGDARAGVIQNGK